MPRLVLTLLAALLVSTNALANALDVSALFFSTNIGISQQASFSITDSLALTKAGPRFCAGLIGDSGPLTARYNFMSAFQSSGNGQLFQPVTLDGKRFGPSDDDLKSTGANANTASNKNQVNCSLNTSLHVFDITARSLVNYPACVSLSIVAAPWSITMTGNDPKDTSKQIEAYERGTPIGIGPAVNVRYAIQRITLHGYAAGHWGGNKFKDYHWSVGLQSPELYNVSVYGGYYAVIQSIPLIEGSLDLSSKGPFAGFRISF